MILVQFELQRSERTQQSEQNQQTAEGSVCRHSRQERRTRNDDKSSANNEGLKTMNNHRELTKDNQETPN